MTQSEQLMQAPPQPSLGGRAWGRSALRGTPLVLPHEWAFSAFLLLMMVRLSLAAGPFEPRVLAFAGYLVVAAALAAWTERSPTPARWRIRLLWYPCLMAFVFYGLPGAIGLLHVARADTLLARWDIALLGAPATDYLAPLEQPLLTEAMVVAYLFFFYYLVFGPAHYCIHDLPRFRACMVGLFTLYPLGFLGYTLFPAHGPHLDASLRALELGPLARLALPLIDSGSNGVDVFPSIHAAASVYLLAFDAWHYRSRFWKLLLPTAALWCSTVYLRYHYVVDLAAGLAIAAVGMATARWYEHSRLAARIEAAAGRCEGSWKADPAV